MSDTGILAAIVAIVIAAILIMLKMPSSPQNYKNELHSIADSLAKCANQLYHMNLNLSLILRELTEMNVHNRDTDKKHVYGDDTVISTEEV